MACCCLFILQFHFPCALIQVGSCSPLLLGLMFTNSTVSNLITLLLFWCFSFLLTSCDSFVFDLIGVAAPFTLNSTLKFCPYNGSVCCNSTQDGIIQRQFQGMNISDPACASLVKSIACAVRLVDPQNKPDNFPLFFLD